MRSALLLAMLLAPLAHAETDGGSDAGTIELTEADEADGGDELPDGLDPEAEAGKATAPTDGGLLYSAELSDEALLQAWVDDLPSLGSISVGFAEAGRLINGVPMPEGPEWTVVVPDCAFGTKETIDALVLAARTVHEQVPAAKPLRVNHIGKKEGGYVRPHHSHQSGRDVDLGFFYRAGVDPAAVKGTREGSMDLAANWALVRALVTQSDPQLILLDRRVQKVLFEYALAQGEDRAWLDGLFHAGADSLFQHVPRHRDHFHVRFFSGRSQELGWRIQPLLAKRSDENVVIHRVKSGDTLGHLATHYGSSVKLIQKANGMKDTTLRVGRTLNVPLRGPCTQCPLPAQVLVPPRRLPPSATAVGAP